MCGITGILSFADTSKDLKDQIEQMNTLLVHRGPDAGGAWVSQEGTVALGHRRLSILDLSETGNQPMISSSGRYVLVYNGETYNYASLRKDEDLTSLQFRGASDTEVLLAGFETWGITETVERMVGMFAFAVWDQQEQSLYLARDRFGKKPLYVGRWKNQVAFASEIQALETLDPRMKVDRQALDSFLRRGYIRQPASIYQEVRQVPPGHILCIRPNGDFASRQYWSPSRVARESRGTRFAFDSLDEAVDRLEPILAEAVQDRMVADVPLGAFLSGGIDSSLVVALMQRVSEAPIRTFTIGFEDEGYDESGAARAVAEHLGTDHKEQFVTPEDAQAVIPLLSDMYGEPFADSSQIPTYLVSKLAKRDVTVVLSGDGADEVFAGYNRYQVERVWKKARLLPFALRRLSARGLTTLSPGGWDRLVNNGGVLVPRPLRVRLPGDKIHKGAALLESPGIDSLYELLTNHQPLERGLVHGVDAPGKAVQEQAADCSFTEQIMLQDTEDYLVGDILTKVDRATMAASLEARAPFLDHRVFSFAWRLPMEMKSQHGKGKIILRRLLHRYVPQELVERPKMGFGIPVGQWIRGPLHDWANDLLDERKVRSDGFLRPEPIQKLWDEHRSGRRNWEAALWDVLMFQQWLEKRR